MDDRPFDAPNLLRHAAGRLHGFPDISEDLLDAADEIERLRTEYEQLRAEAEAWRTAAMGASTQAVRLREQIIEWARSLNEADVPRTAAEDALFSVAYGYYSARPSLHEATTKEDDRG